MNKLLELNRPAYQYYKACLPVFLDICQPLFDLGAKYFGYLKVFEDGSYIGLASNEHFEKAYFTTITDQGCVGTPQIESTPLHQSLHYTIPSCILLADKREPILHLSHAYDIWHYHVIYKNQLTFVEAYCFAMNVADFYAPQFYAKNMPLLEHFCQYFSEKAADLITTEDVKKRAYFLQKFNFSKVSDDDNWEQRAEKFLKETQLSRTLLRGNNNDVILSKREAECLRYLALGQSIKEIAKELSLSPRTVEFYLKNIKEKAGYTNKSQAISAYLRSQPTSILNYSYTKVTP